MSFSESPLSFVGSHDSGFSVSAIERPSCRRASSTRRAPFAPLHKRSAELEKPLREPARAFRALVRLATERRTLGSHPSFREPLANDVLSDVDVSIHELLLPSWSSFFCYYLKH